MTPALAFESVARSEGSVEILSSVSAAFLEGALVALVGADGAGKTTLMRIAAGILQPTSGCVRIFGEDLYGDVARLQKKCGYMPQKFGLYEDLSVEENFNLYADLFALGQTERKERTEELLRMTDLTRFTKRLAGKLSGGMKQKLGLACSLLNRPRILLLDEPTVGVDPLSRCDLWRILRENVVRESMLVVVATTYMDEAALCDEVIILEDGKMRAAGKPAEITDEAKGRTFWAYDDASAGARPVRLLQSELISDIEHLLDAVPEAGMVRVLSKKVCEPGELEALFPGVHFERRQETLEDGYLVMRERLRGEWRKAEKENWIARHQGQKEVLIRAHDLVRKFGDFTAVDSTSFEVSSGEIFGLLGPNGAGKTTTFKMLCGLLEVTSGELAVAGIDVRIAREKAREEIGYMSQKFALYPGISVRDNLEFFAGAYGLTGKVRKERIDVIVRAFGLEDYLSKPASELPGGFKQRLSMAVALLHRPKILFLDEPTSGADIPTRRQFWKWMTSLAANGTTIVVTTHFMEEALYCDRILIQDAGKSLILGTPEEVRSGCASMNDAFIRVVSEHREAAP